VGVKAYLIEPMRVCREGLSLYDVRDPVSGSIVATAKLRNDVLEVIFDVKEGVLRVDAPVVGGYAQAARGGILACSVYGCIAYLHR
jgi:hypothetical protein